MTSWILAWLWQGLVLAFGVSVAFRLLPRVNASTRCVIWWCTFVALVWLGWSLSPQMASVTTVSMDGAAQRGPAAFTLFEVKPLPGWVVSAIVILWLSGAVSKLLALLPGMRALYRLKSSCACVPQSIAAQLPLWQEVRKTGRPAQLMICNSLPNAAVLGLSQPFIVFPSQLLDVVSPAELDQILLHEYGHVQRRDDWTRLLQTILEAALWLHPAARWIASELNLEREVACDDWVVSRTGAARTYAGCLSRVMQNRRGSIDAVLVPALFRRTPDVLKRVDRLLNPRRSVTRHLSFAASGIAVCIIAASAAHLRAFPLIAEVNVTITVPRVAGILNVEKAREASRIEDSSIPEPETMPEVVVSARSPRSGGATPTSSAATPTSTPAPTNVATVPAAAPHIEVVPIIDSQPFHPNNPTANAPVLLPPQGASSAQDTRNGWQITGGTIGTVARKASVSLAGTVAKASVSLAKGF